MGSFVLKTSPDLFFELKLDFGEGQQLYNKRCVLID